MEKQSNNATMLLSVDTLTQRLLEMSDEIDGMDNAALKSYVALMKDILTVKKALSDDSEADLPPEYVIRFDTDEIKEWST